VTSWVGWSIVLILALTALAIPARFTVAATPPNCFNRFTNTLVPATKWLDSAGTLTGTSGDDVLVGSLGSDTIKGKGGNDIICGAPWPNDLGQFDNITGDNGNDVLIGAGYLDGGSGDDWVEAYGWEGSPPSRSLGGSGSDEIYTYFGTADGGSGNDKVVGYNAVALYGGSGSDTVYNGTTGNRKIDCGSAFDRVDPNGAIDVTRCEEAFTQ
jgi:Ca2+-binding RTX toxin-like protein